MDNLRSETGRVVSVNLSEQTGTIKQPVPEIVVDGRGVVNDAHAGDWHRQVSLLAIESIERFAAEAGRSIGYGEFAENITTRGVDLARVAVFDRFVVGDVQLEVTQLGKKCHGSECAIFLEIGKCVMPKEGIFCRVITGGTIRAEDEIVYEPRPLRVYIVTLSDRASRGAYTDRSGPRIRECLDAFFKDKRWHTEIESTLLPDDPVRLQETLESVRAAGVDIVITTGGTGVGPKDITPDVVTRMADRLIPGIMEHIRLKYGAEKPNALLSRSVAAVVGETLVFTLPGSVRAVDEYMTEILKTLEHLLFMLHELDTH